MPAFPVRKRYSDIIFAVICVIIGVLGMFMLENADTVWVDESYQAVCVRRYKEAPLGLLVFWIGHLWTQIFGFSFLSLRILASVEGCLSVLLTSCYLYHHTRNLRLSAIVFLLCCVLLRAGGFYIYNWDSGSYLFDSLALCILISSISKADAKRCLLLGASIALMTLGRMPSGILLIPAVLLVCLAHKKRSVTNFLKPSFLILFSWLLTMTIMTWIILGNPINYINQFLSGNVITGHSPVTDIHRLFGRLAIITLEIPNTWFIGIVTIILSVIITGIKKRGNTMIVLCGWLLFCCFYSYWYSRSSHVISFISGIDTPVGIGLLLTLPVYKLFNRKLKAGKLKILQLWGCAFLILSISFGSDGFSRRMITAFAIPIIMAILWGMGNYGLRRYLKSFLVTGALTFTSVLWIHFATTVWMTRDCRKSDIYPYNGLKVYNESVYKKRKEVSEALKYIRTKGIPYIYLGNHIFSEAIGGAAEGLSFHEYHNTLVDERFWKNFKESAGNKIDAIVYYQDWQTKDYEGIINEMREEGFTKIVEIGDARIIIRDKRINPLKQYTIINDSGKP